MNLPTKGLPIIFKIVDSPLKPERLYPAIEPSVAKGWVTPSGRK